MLLTESPFTAGGGASLPPPPSDIKFEGTFQWLCNKRRKRVDKSSEEDKQPETRLVEDQPELASLLDAATNHEVKLPQSLVNFCSTTDLRESSFNQCDSHRLDLSERLMQLEGGYLIRFLCCNQDANFFYIYVAKPKSGVESDHCVVYSSERYDQDDDDQEPLKVDDFEYTAESTEHFLWQLKDVYDSVE